MWNVLENEAGERHVVPIRDSRKHRTTQYCWCNPTCDDEVWVHNSADQRERMESGKELVN